MSRTLYNEGRVVGYSAYEIYVRQLLATDPSATPSTEKEWLASMMAMGSSLLLRVGKDTTSGAHYRDIQLPTTTSLCAANNIIASFFSGEGYIGSVADTADAWATKVTDYGNLISNTSESSPSGTTTHSSSIPTKSSVAISDDTMNQLESYIKITDGIIIQPGTWTTNANTPPAKDFSPTLSDYPMLRLSFSDTVETPFYILLTGFTNKGVVVGTTGFASVNTDSPQDGDFLGPWAFPWAAKVFFSIPPYAMSAITSNGFEYSRKQPKTSTSTDVDSDPIIDMKSANPTAGTYGDRYTGASIPIDVTAMKLSKDNAAVLALWSNADSNYTLPPSLYGTVVTATGETAIYPIDTNAPDTLHLYEDCVDYTAESIARTLESSASGAKAFTRDKDTYVVNELDSDTSTFVPVASTRLTSLFGAVISEPKTYPLFYVEGTSLRTGITQKWNGSDGEHNGGTAVITSELPSGTSPWLVDKDYWYLEVDSTIASQYPEITSITILVDGQYESVSGIPGTTAILDTLKYCNVGCMIYKRFTGKMSNKVKELCGYTTVYDASGDRIGEFASGGIWEHATMNLFGQIESTDRINYYAIFPNNAENAFPLPVRNSDNIVDSTFRYQFNIYVNGAYWNIPYFTNQIAQPNTGIRSSAYLGSWWDSHTDDGLEADYYKNGWAKIEIDGVTHPTAYSTIADQATGQCYMRFAMLPNTGFYSATMSEFFGSALTNSGIKAEFQSMTVLEFLQTALYTDMGTGNPLPYTNSNILQSTHIYTNGYDESQHTYSREAMRILFNLNVRNSAANAGKTQIMFIPDEYLDDDNTDPVGVVTETGRKQALSLSMSDMNNTPYPVFGTAGDIILPNDGKITWQYLLQALAENKSLDALGAILAGLRTSLTGSGNNYLEFAGSGGNHLRLYISATEPTDNDIPEGSIGMGW